MERKLSIGGLPDGAFLARNVELPVLEYMEAQAWITDALDHAITERKGVAVIGEKGTGKTVALRQALLQFEDTEAAAKEADEGYHRHYMVEITAPRAEKRRDIIEVLWKGIVGMEPPTRRGKRTPDDLLLEQLVEEILAQDVALLALDEAENLSSEGLTVLRDVVSMAESRAGERYIESRYRSAGVGILLLGTRKLEYLIRGSGEAGHRWLRIQQVEPSDAERAAKAYQDFLPGIVSHVEEMGEEAWIDYVWQVICLERPIPIRFIENHVRNYARRMFTHHEGLEGRANIPFDQEIWDFTLSEAQRAQSEAA